MVKLDEFLSYSFSLSPNLPSSIYSSNELIVIVKIVQWLSGKQNFDLQEKTWHEICQQLFVSSPSVLDFALSLSDFVTVDEILSHPFRISDQMIREDHIGNWLQKSLDMDTRKKLASNYTSESTSVLSMLLQRWDYETVADPYCGSGRLICGYLENLKETKNALPSKIIINDLMPTAVFIAICQIYLALPELKRINASIGDGFSLMIQADLILINPPFTRSHRIPESTKRYILSTLKIPRNTPMGQAGLHQWACLQALTMLNTNGTLLAVLPLASIASSYSRFLQTKLLDLLATLKFLTKQTVKAYSDSSEIKEIVLYGDLEVHEKLVTFITAQDISIATENRITRSRLLTSWNWGMFFKDAKLLDILHRITTDLNLVAVQKQHFTIKRGIEMYGPNFFFFPNRYVSISKNKTNTILTMSNYEFEFPHDWFVPILRQPKLYKNKITPEINEICLTVKESSNDNLVRYIKYHGKEAKVAQQKFGIDWVTHPLKQLTTKEPVGQVFIVDKLDLTASPTLAYYTPIPMACTKNFYVIQPVDIDPILLAAWMNSSIYIFLYLMHRREIGGTYGRLQIVDYYSSPIFLPISNYLIDDDSEQIVSAFNKLRHEPLPSITHQFDHPIRHELDQAWLQYLGLDLSPKQLYSYCRLLIHQLSSR